MAKKNSGFIGERRWWIPGPVENEIVSSDRIPPLMLLGVGYYPDAKFHFFSRSREMARYYVLIYCYKGRGIYEIEGVKHRVESGDVFVLPKDKAHCYYSDNDDPWTIYWAHFVGTSAKKYADMLQTPVKLLFTANSRLEYRLELFEELFNAARWCSTVEDLEYANAVLFHFLGSITGYRQFYRSRVSSTKQGATDVVTRAIHYMRENIGHHISLQEVADAMGYSVSRFSVLFREKTGVAPLQYLTQMRIDDACKYLTGTDYKINQICFILGFDNALYFTRVFTSLKGMSPTAYRKKFSAGPRMEE